MSAAGAPAAPPSGYVHDESLWPVSVTMIPARALDAEIVEHMRYVDGLYARGEPFLTVTFISLRTRITSGQRAMMSRWMNDTQAQMEALNKGAVFITGSTMFRFVLSGLMLLSPLPIPYEVFSEADAAAPWLRRKLAENELEAPFDLATGLRRLERRFQAG
ncbi:MAG TPA: hypothetical protein RMH99_02310 [Sandaracinaceae bacterium LLY-WYZ-13_1]|nr:hypothetical protein [Sandaracinaceae bacterium LLY-WYZ-13_1]